MDRQIPFPLSNALHVNGEKNGQPLLHDFPEDIQFMDIEDSSGNTLTKFTFTLNAIPYVLKVVSSLSSIATEPSHVFAAGSVLCPFLEDHKEDILCGPVWLASGLDLSGHAGMLSLTSPKLVKGSVDHHLGLPGRTRTLD